MGRTKTVDDDELLRRAREVFRQSGHTASTREVARAAGISQAVLYQRFGSKNNLPGTLRAQWARRSDFLPTSNTTERSSSREQATLWCCIAMVSTNPGTRREKRLVSNG